MFDGETEISFALPFDLDRDFSRVGVAAWLDLPDFELFLFVRSLLPPLDFLSFSLLSFLLLLALFPDFDALSPGI